ncbi:MAG: helix-turn-helix domain-containing protein [Anaerolineae bacterium]|nr:helix-turn-helix domain-containing protein [Anaerolineae bacterium]
MRRLKMEGKLTVEGLEVRYRNASDGVARSQWQIIWLLAKGQRSEAIAEMTGYSQAWIRVLAGRYNARGEVGIGDGRHHNPGKAVTLSQADQVELKTLLEKSAVAGEKWSGPQVAAWMSERFGRRLEARALLGDMLLGAAEHLTAGHLFFADDASDVGIFVIEDLAQQEDSPFQWR